jgi:hypothetical protein
VAIVTAFSEGAVTQGESRLRWLPVATIVALGWLALFPIVSVDAHYHLATGRRILEDGRIPDRGVGSATFGDKAWHDNEWGFQLLAALVGRAVQDESGVWELTRGGAAGLILMRVACLALTLALLSAQMARSGVGPLTRSVALALAAFLTFGNLFWTVRPQIFSYLGLALIAWLLERHRGGAAWAAWATLPVVAVWANLHGAFVIGIALLGTEAFGETVQRRLDGRSGTAAVRRLWVVTVLAPLAACINPHGYLQVLHPFIYLLRPEIHRGNAEWTRPDFLHLPLFVLTLGLLAVALVAQGRPRIADLTRGAAFTVLLFTAIRHLPLAAIILVPVLGHGHRRALRGFHPLGSPFRHPGAAARVPARDPDARGRGALARAQRDRGRYLQQLPLRRVPDVSPVSGGARLHGRPQRSLRGVPGRGVQPHPPHADRLADAAPRRGAGT